MTTLGVTSLAKRKQPVFFISYDDAMQAIHTVHNKYPLDTNAWGSRTRRDLQNFIGRAFDRSPYKILGEAGGQSLIPMSDLSDYIEIHRTPKASAYANNALVYLSDLIRRYGGRGVRVGLYFENGRTIVSPKYRKPSSEYNFELITSSQLYSTEEGAY